MQRAACVVGLLALLCSSARADGDLTTTLTWTAQDPAWQTSKTDTGVINTALLNAWRQASQPNGPICAAIWQQAAKLNGAGGCLRNLYQTGNVCQLDQSPSITVHSVSGGVAASVAFNNNYLKAIFSLQSGPGDVCGTTQDFDGDPQFNITVSGVGNMKFDFHNNQLSVGSFTADITSFELGGANNSAGFLITLANLVGAFDGLKNDLTQTFDFTSQANTYLNQSPVNADIAKVLQPLQGIGITSSLAADANGVHLELKADACLPRQTAATFPCDGTRMCLSAADWTKINSEATSCRNSYLGHGILACHGFPDAANRGPLPPGGWFTKGHITCTAPSASQAEAILGSAQAALGACQNHWETTCLNQIPGCQQFVQGGSGGASGGTKCDINHTYTTGPCSPAALAAANAANAKNAALQACEASQAKAVQQCQSQVSTATASTCASQTQALSNAQQLCKQVRCGGS